MKHSLAFIIVDDTFFIYVHTPFPTSSPFPATAVAAVKLFQQLACNALQCTQRIHFVHSARCDFRYFASAENCRQLITNNNWQRQQNSKRDNDKSMLY